MVWHRLVFKTQKPLRPTLVDLLKRMLEKNPGLHSTRALTLNSMDVQTNRHSRPPTSLFLLCCPLPLSVCENRSAFAIAIMSACRSLAPPLSIVLFALLRVCQQATALT